MTELNEKINIGEKEKDKKEKFNNDLEYFISTLAY